MKYMYKFQMCVYNIISISLCPFSHSTALQLAPKKLCGPCVSSSKYLVLVMGLIHTQIRRRGT